MIIVKPEKLGGLVPRMLELTSRRTPWHRRDWRAGTLELAEEALNEARIPGTSETALSEMHSHMSKALGTDPGVSRAQRGLIPCLRTINPSAEENSHNVQLAEHFIQDLKDTYLENWADIFDSPDKAGELDVEGTAKRIISHLLYCGVPASSVYLVIESYRDDSRSYSFSDLLRELDGRTKTEVKDFHFAVPVDHAPDFFHSPDRPKDWLTPKELKQWKHNNAPRAERQRHHGGFILTVQARDVNGAEREAQRQLAQLSFKFRSGSDNQFSMLPLMWSQEKGLGFATQREAQSLKLRAFQRANVLHELEIGPKSRNILAIISPLETHDPHVAIVNGWMAIESLLVDANEDDRIGAERMARVVAASYFRTEMTWLARNYAEEYRDECLVASQIGNSEKSIDRSILMAQAILGGNNFSRLDEPDLLAIQKMREALENPSAVFDRAFEILKREFQRLYRKRNLIVHSGRVVENGIESVADKILPPLVNGLDQLLVANLQRNVDPKALAASVEFKSLHLGRGGNSKRYSILGLLEED